MSEVKVVGAIDSGMAFHEAQHQIARALEPVLDACVIAHYHSLMRPEGRLVTAFRRSGATTALCRVMHDRELQGLHRDPPSKEIMPVFVLVPHVLRGEELTGMYRKLYADEVPVWQLDGSRVRTRAERIWPWPEHFEIAVASGSLGIQNFIYGKKLKRGNVYIDGWDDICSSEDRMIADWREWLTYVAARGIY